MFLDASRTPPEMNVAPVAVSWMSAEFTDVVTFPTGGPAGVLLAPEVLCAVGRLLTMLRSELLTSIVPLPFPLVPVPLTMTATV